MISPSLWWDPVEEFWATQRYSIEQELKRKSAFGSCWTVGQKNDALWQIYSRKAPAIRVRTSAAKLVTAIEHAPELASGKIFAGRVAYLSDKEMINRAARLSSAAANKDSSRHLAKGMMMKREAYGFEDELRLVWIKSGLSRKKSVAVKIDPRLLFDQIRIDPRLDPAVAEAVASVLSRLSLISDCKQSTLRVWEYPKPESA